MKKKTVSQSLSAQQRRNLVDGYDVMRNSMSNEDILALREVQRNKRREEIEELEKRLGFDNSNEIYHGPNVVAGTTAYNAFQKPTILFTEEGDFVNV